jgi:hypothetical protein
MKPIIEVAEKEDHHLGLGDHRHRPELEARERLSGSLPRHGLVALDASAASLRLYRGHVVKASLAGIATAPAPPRC